MLCFLLLAKAEVQPAIPCASDTHARSSLRPRADVELPGALQGGAQAAFALPSASPLYHQGLPGVLAPCLDHLACAVSLLDIPRLFNPELI